MPLFSQYFGFVYYPFAQQQTLFFMIVTPLPTPLEAYFQLATCIRPWKRIS
jgi:hypothetical protein